MCINRTFIRSYGRIINEEKLLKMNINKTQLFFVLLLVSVNLQSKTVSFDCEGVRENREEYGDRISKFEVDLDLDKETGFIQKIHPDTSEIILDKLSINPSYVKGYKVNTYLNKEYQYLYIDRKTLAANVADWNGSCKIVDRSEKNAF